MDTGDTPYRLVIGSGLVPVDLSGENPRAEIEARQMDALEQARERAADKAGGAPYEERSVSLGTPISIQGRNYVSATVSLALDVSEDVG